MRTKSQYILLLLLAVLAVTVLLSGVIHAKKSKKHDDDDDDEDEGKTVARAIVKKTSKSKPKSSKPKKNNKSCNKRAQQIIQLYKCRSNVRRLLRLKNKCERAIATLTEKKKTQEAQQLKDKCYHGSLKLRLRINRICSKRYKCKFAIRALSRISVECRKYDVQIAEEKKKGDKADKKLIAAVTEKQETCNKERRALRGKIRRNCAAQVRCFRARIEARKVCNDTKHVDKKKEDQLRRVIRRCKTAVRKAKHRCAEKVKKPTKKLDKGKYRHAKQVVKLARRHVRKIRHEATKAKDLDAKKKILRKLEHARVALVEAERKLRKFDGYKQNCKVAQKKVARKTRRCKKWRNKLEGKDAKKAPTDAQKKFYQERLNMCIEVLREYREKAYRVCGDRCKKLSKVTKSKACNMAINSWKKSNTIIKNLQRGLASAKDAKAKATVEENLRKEKRSRFDAGRRMRCYCKTTTRQCEISRYQFNSIKEKCRKNQESLNQDKEASSSGGFLFGLFGGSTAKSIPKDKKASVLKQKRKCPEQIRHYRSKMERACSAKCKTTSPEMKAYKCKHSLSENKSIIKKCKTLRHSWKITKDAAAKKVLLKSLHECREKRSITRQNIDCYCKFTCEDAIKRFNELQARLDSLIEKTVVLEKNKKKNKLELQHVRSTSERVARLRTNLGYKLATKCKSSIVPMPEIGNKL